MDLVKIKLYAPPNEKYSEELESLIQQIEQKYSNVSYLFFPVAHDDSMTPVFVLEVRNSHEDGAQGKYLGCSVNMKRLNWREVDSRVCSFLEDILKDGEPYGLIQK